MAFIRAQKIPEKIESPEVTLARFCFYFQQYTFHQARKLPYKYVVLMLSSAEKERARFLYDLTNAISSPHTKKGAGVKKMLDYCRSIIDK